MAFSHGKNVRVYYNEFDMSSFFNNVDLGIDVDIPETTTYGVDDRTYIGGLRSGSMSLSGFFDGSADAVDEEFATQLGTAAEVITVAPNLATVGNPVYIGSSFLTNYSISAPVDGVITVSSDIQCTSGLHDGASLHNLGAETATDTETSFDSSATTTTGGGVGHLHVTAVTGTILVKIQDSPDNSAWADLISFTVTGSGTPTSERIAVTGNVDRYVHVTWTIATGPATFMVGFARL